MAANPERASLGGRARTSHDNLDERAENGFHKGDAGIAQLVEQLICNQQVVGSNPTAGSRLRCATAGGPAFSGRTLADPQALSRQLENAVPFFEVTG